MNARKIRQYIELLNKLNPPDIISIRDSESSMLPHQLRMQFLDKFQTKIVPHYQQTYTEAKGTDNVLAKLEQILLDKIKKTPNENKAEKRRYTAAYNALINPDDAIFYPNRVPGGMAAWPNVLHKNSHETMSGVYLRNLLAYYWLAASDAKMEIDPQSVAECGSHEKAVEASVENFFAMLEEIRRAHNEGAIADNVKDNPSCIPGTLGRIFLRGSIYNKLTAIPRSPYPLVPDAISTFILQELDAAHDNIKQAFYAFINFKLMLGDQPNEKEISAINDFIAQLKAKENKVVTHVLRNFADEKNPEKRSKETVIIKQIFHSDLHTLKDDFQNLDSNFVSKMQKISIKGMRNKIINESIQATLVSFYLNLSDTAIFVHAMERELLNESVRRYLSPLYKKSEKAKAKLAQLKEQFTTTFQPASLAIKDYAERDLDRAMKERVERNVIAAAAEHGAIFPNPDEKELTENKNTSSKNFVAAIKAKIQKADQQITHIEQLFTAIDTDTIDIETLPSIPYKKLIMNPFIPEKNWAQQFIRIATETDEKGNLLADERELMRLTRWMVEQFKSASQPILTVMTYINDYLDHYILKAQLNEKTLTEAKKLLEKTFQGISVIQKDFKDTAAAISDTDSIKYDKLVFTSWFTLSKLILTKKGTISEEKVAEDEDNLPLPYYTQLAFNIANIKSDADFVRERIAHEKLLKNWQQIALRILKDKPKDNFVNFFSFVLFSAFFSLKIESLRRLDANNLQWLCKVYLGLKPKPDNQYLPFYPENNSITLKQRVENLAAHLSMLFTTIKPVSELFQSGYVRMMGRQEANDTLNEAKHINPFFVRTSYSNPTALVLCKPGYNHTRGKEELWPRKINATKHYCIAGQRLPLNLESSTIQLKNILENLAFNNKLILGTAPFHSILSYVLPQRNSFYAAPTPTPAPNVNAPQPNVNLREAVAACQTSILANPQKI